jgi:hypothetical protein
MPYSTWIRTAVLCVLTTLSSSLYASDSVVLINQSSVAAGNVTPGDAPGFPVTLSVPGSYRLASNLILNQLNVPAIDITADNVTLDLNGYSIIGPCKDSLNAPPTCPSAGIGSGVQAIANSLGGPQSVKVLNGSVRGMGSQGVQLAGKDSVVKNVASDGNGGSGFIVNGSVMESSATDNGKDGIRAVVVRDSLAVHNGDHGLFIDFGGVAAGNVVTLNGGRGMFVRNATVIANTVTSNHGIGILAECPSSIINNTAIGDSNFAAIATDGDGCAVVNNGANQ